ncbi:hypothetical protein C0992_004914 [Termitomyces sp. T32_za158]|nr:hypothetical protein C0992_004914 [Termitomyces sp. T32_za158]
MPPVAGPSQQIIPVNPVKPVLRSSGVVLSDSELPSGAKVQSDHEEAAEASDSSEPSSEVLAVPRRVFLWLRKALDYPISALRPSEYIEAAKEKAAGMAEVMQKDVWAAVTEMEGLCLRKKIMERSMDILEQYQADCTEALE